MLRESLVLLLVALEVLLLSPLHAAGDEEAAVSRLPIDGPVGPFEHHEFLFVTYHLRVDGIGGRVTEREVVDGVEHIGLAHAVVSDEAIDLWRELQSGFRNVFVVDKCQLFEYHGAKLHFFSAKNEKKPNY